MNAIGNVFLRATVYMVPLEAGLQSLELDCWIGLVNGLYEVVHKHIIGHEFQ